MSAAPLRSISLAIALLAAGLSAGCAQIKDHKGYIPDSVLIGSVLPGTDNKESVVGTLGRPSFVGQFDPNTWYYLSRNTRQLAFRMPRATDQLLLTVKFDQAGNVVSVNRSGVDQVASISPGGGKTPTLGRDRGFFQELFGNIGRVGGSSQGASTADNPQ